jgi:hypothetical protein
MKVKECVGCGYCCIKTPCEVSRRLYPTNQGPCPQLEWKDNRYFCSLMLISGPLGENYRKELHAGAGCCCGLNDWRKNVTKREVQLNRTAYNPLPEIMQVFIRCLAEDFMSSDRMILTLSQMASILEKDGYGKDEIKSIYNGCMHIFNENRSNFMKDFMG